MARVFLRPKAVDDLTGIWDYTVETWGIEQAERYVRLVNRSFEELAGNPGLGRTCDALREGYRKHLSACLP
jgi:toxin ParE1/3/4